jgi:hypothetical protein
MYFDNITLEAGTTLSKIGGVKAIIAGEGTPILHALSLQNIIGTFTLGDTIQSASDATQTGLLFQYINNTAYLIKDTLADIPYTDAIKDVTSSATATRGSTFVTNHTEMNIPLYEIDKDTIKTLYNGDGNNTTTYAITTRNVITVADPISSAVTYTSAVLGDEDTYEDYSTLTYNAVIVNAGSEDTVDLTGLIDVAVNGKSYTLTVNPGSPMVGKTVWVYSAVNKVNIAESAKTVSSPKTTIIRTPSSSYMSLEDQDIIRIAKVVDGKTAAIYLEADPTEAISFDTGAEEIVVNTAEPHNLSAGDVVVIKGVECSDLSPA